MANRNWASGGKIYSMHVSPVLLDCNFVVDSANGNGFGIRSLKGPAVQAVYMHTSATPAAGNPNPAPGFIIVQLADNYNRYLSGFAGAIGPIGTPSNSVTAGTPVTITSLGTTTQAQFQAAGLPIGMTAAVGASFTPTATGAMGGTGTAAPVATTGSGIDHIEIVGDPNATIASTQPQAGGALLTMRCMLSNATATPADGSVISLAMLLSNSSILVQGE